MKSYQDTRLTTGLCAYCFEEGDTLDHTPSKILLDEPYPKNLITVRCCLKCNNEISADELYFACAIECTQYGTADPDSLNRTKIKKAITNDKKLHKQLNDSFIVNGQQKYFQFDNEAVNRVLSKLVRAHLRYELDEYETGSPSQIWFKPISLLNDKEKASFYTLNTPKLYPEIGSPAFVKMIEKGLSWNIIQQGAYEYAFVQDTNIVLKLLIRNWLAVQAVWED